MESTQPQRIRDPRWLLLTDDALLAECEVDHYRSSGPGGQKRNKTSSAVRLRHKPSGLLVTASEDRSQHVNLGRAIRRLREAIATELRVPFDARATLPTAMFSTCISDAGDFRTGPRDPRYYQAVAELLDFLAACNGSTAQCAERIGLSTARLIKLLHADEKVWAMANRIRAAAGLHALR